MGEAGQMREGPGEKDSCKESAENCPLFSGKTRENAERVT